MNILLLNDLALELVARDFSDGHTPNNGGPTKTSRALAIIHLAAHDAYAKVTGSLVTQYEKTLGMLPAKPSTLATNEQNGTAAMLGAGLLAAEQLYPDFRSFISEVTSPSGARKLNGDILKIPVNTNAMAVLYGRSIAEAWLSARKNDKSDLPQLDNLYSDAPGRHRPDPTEPGQMSLGRTWGLVKPFVLKDVATEAFLKKPPELNSQEYAESFDEVAVSGRDNIAQRDELPLAPGMMPPKRTFREKAIVGIFWGYDGSNRLGTPPRLYNQVVREIPGVKNATSHALQIKILTAINVAMADAGIAAWYWKYEYDFWRPVVGIREADGRWGPTGIGDGNTLRKEKENPFWLPLGAPKSNPTTFPVKNGTPNFPAYPSGHSTFGSAAFKTAAMLLNQQPELISITFVSDEFNGRTTDNTGNTRPKFKDTFSLQQAIDDNEISRIYLGVHWKFDATGGKAVGEAIANKVVEAFR